MPLTVITSDQVSANQVFTLQANLVMGNVTMTTVGITTGNSTVNTTAIAVGNVVANTTVLAIGNSFINASAYYVGNSTVNVSINSTSIAINGSAGTNNQVLASNGSATYWANAVAGATGANGDMVFWQNNTAVTSNYTIPANVNAGTFGPVTIGANVTVTISNTATWTIV